MNELEFHLSRSLKVKVNGAITKLTCDFLLVNNSKYMYMPICSILEDIASQNMIDLSRSLKLMPLLESPYMTSY